ncbi:hypothetical protein EPI10_021434 [Gossypium australe]|uniref:Uncharacterized protein n=1 Tax=Gossypium australe TaxID=47621 RepID=A0A5B6WIP1_9ROSI|nr:hypothetical protein EPI10_021434 [Gossypium australe]
MKMAILSSLLAENQRKKKEENLKLDQEPKKTDLDCGKAKVVKATEGSGPSRIVITLLNLFWYTLELSKARYGMYRLV